MAYIDNNYGNELEAALRKLVSRPALGQPWFGFHESEVPAGVLLFTAGTHSRVLYADFWQYIQDKNLVITEEEWQSIYSTQGWCPFYSDGDGIDTFRMPSAPLYLHGANTLGEAGVYVAEGLPNLTGLAGIQNLSGCGFTPNMTGVFTSGGTANYAIQNPTTAYTTHKLAFDASRSNSIYGASDHVTPATSKLLFGVWAISAPQQPIPDATVEGVLSSLELKAGTDLSNLTTAGKEVAAKMSMPTAQMMTMTVGASGASYTAPADGWLYAYVPTQKSPIGYALFSNDTANYMQVSALAVDMPARIYLPVKKNDNIAFEYRTGGTAVLKFYYAKGAE